jgi:multidrug resistance efflux pump
MIRQLKTRTRADAFANDVRRHSRRLGKYIYLALVVALFTWAADWWVGGVIWLDAAGMVTAERYAISPPYDAQIADMAIVPGQQVKKGDYIGQIYSPQFAQSLALLTSRYAETYARQTELAIRLDVANAMSHLASERVTETDSIFRKMDSTRGSGLVTNYNYTLAMRERYQAMADMATHDAERSSVSPQLANLQRAQEESLNTIRDLQNRYDNGMLYAPEDGIVGPTISHRGDMLHEGGLAAEIYFGEKYALGYLDTGTLYRVELGDKVYVSNGFRSTTGSVVEVLPLTVQLPPEFQRAFKARERGQVIKIRLDDPEMAPLFTTVRITGDRLLPGNNFLTKTRLHHWITG